MQYKCNTLAILIHFDVISVPRKPCSSTNRTIQCNHFKLAAIPKTDSLSATIT